MRSTHKSRSKRNKKPKSKQNTIQKTKLKQTKAKMGDKEQAETAGKYTISSTCIAQENAGNPYF